jgi:hypothetical protein
LGRCSRRRDGFAVKLFAEIGDISKLKIHGNGVRVAKWIPSRAERRVREEDEGSRGSERPGESRGEGAC